MILATSLIFGCVSTQSVMESWQQHHIDELVSAWGAPNSQSEISNGQIVYSWVSNWGSAYLMNTCRQSFTVSPRGTIMIWCYSGCPHWQSDAHSLKNLTPELLK